MSYVSEQLEILKAKNSNEPDYLVEIMNKIYINKIEISFF